MHPYGGTPICPRCSKSVYAAEQTMGPGRKLYHKPCLACTTCNKRLDSYTLLEHDQKPYCKSCHVKNFGTRDLRQANLPHRQESLQSPDSNSATTPSNAFPAGRFATSSPPPISTRRSPSPIRRQWTGPAANRNGNGNGRTISPSPILRPNRALSPTSHTFPDRSDAATTLAADEEALEAEERDDIVDLDSQYPADNNRSSSPVYTNTTTNTGRAVTGFPRTVPLSPSKTGQSNPNNNSAAGAANGDGTPRIPINFNSVTLGRSSSSVSARSYERAATTPIKQTSTGTRYGAALNGGGGTPSPVRQWGSGSTPQCPRCNKSVYFAEQVKAIGKSWHKGCLRCTECGTSLDSKKLTEKDGDPLCHRCYGKLHGPQGGGYALLGKAGG